MCCKVDFISEGTLWAIPRTSIKKWCGAIEYFSTSKIVTTQENVQKITQNSFPGESDRCKWQFYAFGLLG